MRFSRTSLRNFKLLLSLFLREEKEDLYVIVIYGVCIGLCSLGIPIAVQTFVNTIGFGFLIQPILILTVILTTVLTFSGALRILQFYVAELLQQRLFAKVAIAIARKIPELLEKNKDQSCYEINYFLEVATLQKTAAILVVDASAVVLQVLFGLILLAFYHPFLLGLNLIILVFIFLFFFAQITPGIQTSIQESKAKYEVAACLYGATESKPSSDWMQKIDGLTCKYLAARNTHFRVLFYHIVAGIVLEILVSSLLLGIGGWLVIRKQLNLGQLVASELIVSVVVLGVTKFGKYLESYYDFAAALDKIGTLLELGQQEAFVFPKQYLSIKSVQGRQKPRAVSRFIFWALIFWTVCMVFVPWQQTSVGRGRVIAYSPTERRQTIDAPVEGRLGRWFVDEGSHVEEGAPIVEITDNDPEIIRRLLAEKDALQARLNAAQIAEKTAKINRERQQFLLEEGLSSRRSFELAQLESARYQTEEANARSELVRLETRLARQKTQFVRARRNGTILRRTAGEGSVLVKAGTSLAVFVPDTDSRAVEIWIGGNDVALITVGQKVRLQFEGWPAIQFSGWPSVAWGTFAGLVSVIDAAESGDGKFRILIVPDPEAEAWPSTRYLRQGIRAQGWILMGRVKLGFELWRRFNGFPPSLPQPHYSEAPR